MPDQLPCRLTQLIPGRPAFIHLVLLGLSLTLSGCYHCWKPLPDGLDMAGPPRQADTIELLTDRTFIDADGNRRCEQHIFDEAFRIIGRARRIVIVDMFLYNEFIGAAPPPYRPLCRQMTDCLLERKRSVPDIEIVVITDPVNTVYGGMVARHLEELRTAGVTVVITDLDRLRDSNPLWSGPWRLFVKPFGNAPGGRCPNPFDEGRVSLRSWLRLLNFKANHRKVIVADSPDGLAGLVCSANPHGGSSAHSNIGLAFDGTAAFDLFLSECAVLDMSGAKPPDVPVTPMGAEAPQSSTVRILTEKSIEDVILTELEQCGPRDNVALVMFYLADRHVIKALKQASRRGVTVRAILDPNKDAFGRIKKGLPNRQVARELHRAGIPIRWADTHGEQSHTKLLFVRHAAGAATLILGSANFTRRNLDNFNLETDVAVHGPWNEPVFREAKAYVDDLWNNRNGRHSTVPYEKYKDESLLKVWKYRLQEATGMCTW